MNRSIKSEMCKFAHTWMRRTKTIWILCRHRSLDEMARNARAEAMRIETGRPEAHRLLLRRKAELAEFDGNRKKKRNF